MQLSTLLAIYCVRRLHVWAILIHGMLLSSIHATVKTVHICHRVPLLRQNWCLTLIQSLTKNAQGHKLLGLVFRHGAELLCIVLGGVCLFDEHVPRVEFTVQHTRNLGKQIDDVDSPFLDVLAPSL